MQGHKSLQLGFLMSWQPTPVQRIPWTEEPVGYRPWGCEDSDMTEAT